MVGPAIDFNVFRVFLVVYCEHLIDEREHLLDDVEIYLLIDHAGGENYNQVRRLFCAFKKCLPDNKGIFRPQRERRMRIPAAQVEIIFHLYGVPQVSERFQSEITYIQDRENIDGINRFAQQNGVPEKLFAECIPLFIQTIGKALAADASFYIASGDTILIIQGRSGK